MPLGSTWLLRGPALIRLGVWVASLGANYDLNSNYFLTGSLSYTYTKTTLHINTLNLGLPVTVGSASADLKLGNTLVFFGAGYRF